MNRDKTSKVNRFNLLDNGNASYVQFGDHRNIRTKSKGFAIMQSHPTANAGEPMFSQYDIFDRSYKKSLKIHSPKLFSEVNKPNYVCEFPHEEAEKQIDRINIVISSNSSTILIGNGKRHYAENRQKNIRQHLN